MSVEYYLIALTEPDFRAIKRILRTIEKHKDIYIENIVITIRLNSKDPASTGVLGGITNLNDNIILLRGVIPLPRKSK